MSDAALDEYAKTLASIIPLSLACGASFLSFIYLVWFIVFHEIPKRLDSDTLESQTSQQQNTKSMIAIIFTPLNNALALLMDGPGYCANRAFISIFLAFSEASYVYYSWKRGIFVVKRVFPWLAQYIGSSIIYIPILILLQAIPTLVLGFMRIWVRDLNEAPLLNANLYLTGLAGAIVIAFDLVLLTAFIKYVRQANLEGATIEADGKLAIVSRYGIGSIVLSLLMLCVYGAYTVTKVLAFYTLSQLLVGSMLFWLMRMKVRLFQFEFEEKQQLESRISAKLGGGKISMERKSVDSRPSTVAGSPKTSYITPIRNGRLSIQ
ncbi:hypothetical protein HDU79_004173 [Rhizoclosmatium sp. JEL0117]|nr:hypothetical protein HDU79_004173 [Rhizoclosmatium sp. JEL0117]